MLLKGLCGLNWDSSMVEINKGTLQTAEDDLARAKVFAESFRADNPEDFDFLLSTRALEIGAERIDYDNGEVQKAATIGTLESKMLGASRAHIDGLSAERRLAANRVLDALRILFPDMRQSNKI